MQRLRSKPLVKEQVGQKLLDMLASGAFQLGDRLLPELELAKSLDCNRQTLRAALTVLQSKGLIERRQGSGTYVRQLREDESTTRLAGLVIPTHGHVYEDFTRELSSQLQRAGWMPTVATDADRTDDAPFLLKNLENMLALGCRHLLLQIACFGSPVVFNFIVRNATRLDGVVWISYGEHLPPDVPGDIVALDRAYGIRLAVQRLAQLGHRRLTLLTHGVSSPDPTLVKAFQKAAQELGLGESVQTIDQAESAEGKRQQVLALLQAANPPTGFIGDADFRMLAVIEAARELGLRIPEDVSVIGFNDTPWSRDYAMTTLSNENETMAREAALLIGHRSMDRHIRRFIEVRPSLIERTSCGPANERLTENL